MSSPEKRVPLNNLISLTDKRAIVTGGAVGIGFAIARRLTEAGASIVIVDTNREKAQQAVQELRSYGYQATFIQCDVSREDEVRDMVNTVAREMGVIDILVNNAGTYPRIPFEHMTGSVIVADGGYLIS